MGARTSIQDVEGGVALDVTGNDAATSDDIRARTTALLTVVARGKDEIRHTGDGDGPGLGRCPVALHDATITTRPIDRGVRIVVTTNDDEVAWLRRETRARLFELRVPASSMGLGMDHCPSALPSATTDVLDANDGIVVTVVSRDPDVAEAIRGRAWHLAEESRRPGVHAEHAPLASNVRPCPVVLSDTEVTSVDVPGGAQIVVRARLSGETQNVQRLAHARAGAFP
jgi:hypothetical protein